MQTKKRNLYSTFRNKTKHSGFINHIRNPEHKRIASKFKIGNQTTGRLTIRKTPEDLRICDHYSLNSVEGVYKISKGIQGIHGHTGYTVYTWGYNVYKVYRAYMGVQGTQGIRGYTRYTWVYMGIQGIHKNTGYTGCTWE